MKNLNFNHSEEIKQLKEHNANMSAEGKILQSRMMGMQQDFNKYKSLKDKIDEQAKDIDRRKLENDKLSLELQMIKANLKSKDCDQDHYKTE